MESSRTTLSTPLGPYAVAAGPRGITRVEPAPWRSLRIASAGDAAHPWIAAAHVAFDAYFAGEIDALTSLRLDPVGTPFQLRVWDALREIPAGETATYGEIAQRIGRPGAARAVGRANHTNPIAIAIPCHRVIGANGTLVGYAGGLDRKRALLEHEARYAAHAASPNRSPARPASAPALARSRVSAAASI